VANAVISHMMMPLPHQILIILYRPTILSLYTGKRRHCQPLIVLLHLFLFNFIRSFNITVFSKQGMSAKKTYKPVMRSTADAEVASHASQWMLQKCKTSHFFISGLQDSTIWVSFGMQPAGSQNTDLSCHCHMPISTFYCTM